MRAYVFGFGILGVFHIGQAARMETQTPAEPIELRISVCSTTVLASRVACDGRSETARFRSHHAELQAPLHGDWLALPGEIQARLTDPGDVAFTTLNDAEYLHVEVFETGVAEPILRATGRHIVVRYAGGERRPQIEATER